MHQASIMMTFLVMLMGAAWLALDQGYLGGPSASRAISADAATALIS